ncbi:chromosome segregation protein SMC [Lutibacter sp. B2]|nr:chromosome segregation protein SMC [Lutibacter sp. B2]
MYLKKIEIHGFKSFADKTEIEFESGITAIVGPNGSGKSNVFDAVRWVLGEQSAKTLRGNRMDDVIFAGTTERKPVGMAEVSLTLDNKNNKLGIEYSEVTVTRRVYRSGESEYYINKSLCRLKDIKEMFMDTGVGIDGYSIIGQGRIDDILNSKSGNRRLLFDEAAGIVKYRTRKEESEKKLENTDQNLVRVEDIIKELESRLPNLQVQCKKAKTFLQVQNELKDLEINVFIHEIDDLKYNIDTLKEQQNIVQEQCNNYIIEKKEIEKKHEKIKKEIEELDTSIYQLQHNIFETSRLIEKKDGELGLSNEKNSNTEQNVSRIDEDLIEVEENKKGFILQLEELKKMLGNEEEILDKAKKLLKSKKDSLKEISEAIEKQESEMEQKKGDLIETLNNAATKKSEMNSLSTFQNNIKKRKEFVEKEKIELKNNKEKFEKEKENVELYFKELEKELKESEKNRKEIINNIQELRKIYEQLRMDQNNIGQKIQEQSTRKRLLLEMEHAYEGFHKSVKTALIHAKKDKSLGQGIHGVVAELMTVPKGMEVAIEVSLGSAMQNIVCQSAEDARRMIDHLKKNNLGRVTFLPIDRFNLNKLNYKPLDELKNFKGVKGIAMNLVEFPTKFESIVRHLLGNVVIVDKLENGIELSKKMKHKFKIVSLEGDIINTSGAMTGGSYNSRTINILSRKREIQELGNSLSLLQNKYDEKVKEVLENEKQLSVKEKELEQSDVLLKEKEIELVNNKNELIGLNREVENYSNQLGRIDEEISQLNMDLEDTQNSILNKQSEIKQLELDEKNIQSTVSINKDTYEKDKIEKDKLNDEITNFKVKIASHEQKNQHYYENISMISSKIEELQVQKKNKEIEMKRLLENKDYMFEKIKVLNREIQDTNVLKKQYEFNLKKQETKKSEITHIYNEIEGQFKKNNQVIVELQDSSHKMEVRLTRLEMQQQSYFSKLLEEYELTYAQSVSYKKDHVNLGESSKQIKKLKQKIKELGNVNVESIEEYEKIMERYTFLTSQRDDLTNAIKSLNQVIREMESTMEKQFMECFEKIKVNFSEVFKSLFNGGQADLNLIDKESILTTGIDIVAQPPGKKLQNLSLLSGGEKALTAIALLFAILKVKPTPFCILDEIEAALDDANVYRYANFLIEFSKETQFIVVTHRKGTMESVDALYGVTMEEHGVSKLISVKLSEKVS